MAEIMTTQELVDDPRFKEASESEQGFYLQRHRDELRGQAESQGVYDENTEFSIQEHIKGYMPKSAKWDAFKEGFSEMPNAFAKSTAVIGEVAEGQGTEDIAGLEAQAKKLQRGRPIYKVNSRDRLQIERIEGRLKDLYKDREQSQDFKGAREYIEEDMNTPRAQAISEIGEESLMTKVAGGAPQTIADFGAVAGLGFATGGTALPLLAPAVYGGLRSAGSTAEGLLTGEAGKDMTYGQILNRSVATAIPATALEVASMGYLTNLNRMVKGTSVLRKAIPKSRVLTDFSNKYLSSRAGQAIKGGIAEGGQEMTQEFIEKLGSSVGYDQMSLDTALEVLDEYAEGDEWKVAGILGSVMGSVSKGTVGYDKNEWIDVPEGESIGEVMKDFTGRVTEKVKQKNAEFDNFVGGFVGEPLGDIYKTEIKAQQDFQEGAGQEVDDLKEATKDINDTLQGREPDIETPTREAKAEVKEGTLQDNAELKYQVKRDGKNDRMGESYTNKREIGREVKNQKAIKRGAEQTEGRKVDYDATKKARALQDDLKTASVFKDGKGQRDAHDIYAKMNNLDPVRYPELLEGFSPSNFTDNMNGSVNFEVEPIKKDDLTFRIQHNVEDGYVRQMVIGKDGKDFIVNEKIPTEEFTSVDNFIKGYLNDTSTAPAPSTAETQTTKNPPTGDTTSENIAIATIDPDATSKTIVENDKEIVERDKPLRAPYKSKTKEFTTKKGNTVKVEGEGNGDYKFVTEDGKRISVSRTSDAGWVIFGKDAPRNSNGYIGQTFTEAVDYFATDSAPTKQVEVPKTETAPVKPNIKTKIKVSVIDSDTGKTKTLERMVYKDGKVRVDGIPYEVRKNKQGDWQAIQEDKVTAKANLIDAKPKSKLPEKDRDQSDLDYLLAIQKDLIQDEADFNKAGNKKASMATSSKLNRVATQIELTERAIARKNGPAPAKPKGKAHSWAVNFSRVHKGRTTDVSIEKTLKEAKAWVKDQEAKGEPVSGLIIRLSDDGNTYQESFGGYNPDASQTVFLESIGYVPIDAPKEYKGKVVVKTSPTSQVEDSYTEPTTKKTWAGARGPADRLMVAHGYVTNGKWLAKRKLVKLPPSAKQTNKDITAPGAGNMDVVFINKGAENQTKSKDVVWIKDNEGTEHAVLTSEDGQPVYASAKIVKYFQDQIETFRYNGPTDPVYGYDKNGDHVLTFMPLRGVSKTNKAKVKELGADRKKVRGKSGTEMDIDDGVIVGRTYPETDLNFEGAQGSGASTIETGGLDINYHDSRGQMGEMDGYDESQMSLIDGTALINAMDDNVVAKIMEEYEAYGSYTNAKGNQNILQLRGELAVGPRVASMSKHRFEAEYRKFKNQMYKEEKARLMTEEDMSSEEASMLAKEFSQSFTKSDYLSILADEIVADPRVQARGVLPQGSGKQGEILPKFQGKEVIFLQRNHNYAGAIMMHEIGHWIDDSDVMRMFGVNKRTDKIKDKITANIDRKIKEQEELAEFVGDNKEALSAIQRKILDLKSIKDDRQKALTEVLKDFVNNPVNAQSIKRLKNSMKKDMELQAKVISAEIDRINEKDLSTEYLEETIEKSEGPSNTIYAMKRIAYNRRMSQWLSDPQNQQYQKDKDEHDKEKKNEARRKRKYVAKNETDEGYEPTYTESAPEVPNPKPKKPATPPINSDEIAQRMIAFDKNVNFDANVLREEMIQGSKYWRGNWVNPNTYRNRPNELIADMYSLMFNNPAKFKELMPMTQKYLEFYAEDRPIMKERYESLITETSEAESITRTRKELVDDTEAKMNDVKIIKKPTFMDHVAKIVSFTFNQRAVIHRRKNQTIARLRKEAKENGTPLDENQIAKIKEKYLEFAWANQAQIYSSTGAKNYEEIADVIMSEAMKSGITQAEIDSAMFLYRTIGERKDFFNPKGIRGDAGQKILDDLKKTLTDDQIIALEKFRKDFIELRKTVTSKVRESGMASEAFVDFIENNEDYVRFDVQKQGRELLFDSFGLPNVAQRKVGGLGEIDPAVSATIVRDMFILAQADRVISDKALVDSLMSIEENSGSDETAFIKKIKQGDSKAPDGFQLLTLPVDGKPVHYAVHEDFKYLVESTATDELQSMLRKVMSIVRGAWITYNPYFPVKNLARDFLNTLVLEGDVKGLVKSYKNNYERAKQASFKSTYDKRTRELMNRSLLQMDTDSRYEPSIDKQIEKGLYKKRVKEPSPIKKAYDSRYNVVRPILEFISSANNFAEIWSKMASADRIEVSEAGKTMTQKEKDYWIRSTGSPAFLDVGSHASLMNAFFIFSSATMAGHKQQALYAQKDAKGYVLRRLLHTAISQTIPIVMVSLIAKAMGLTEEEEKKMMDNVTTEELVFSNIIPIGYDRESGKTAYFRIGKDHHQMMPDAFLLSMLSDKHTKSAFMSTVASAIPGLDKGALNPLISIGFDIKEAMTGGVPKTRFGQDAYDPELKGILRNAMALTKHEIGSRLGGIGTAVKDVGNVIDSDKSGGLRAGAFVGAKESDSGIIQKDIDHRKSLSADRAQFMIDDIDDMDAGLRESRVKFEIRRSFNRFKRSDEYKEATRKDKLYLSNKSAYTKAFLLRYRKTKGFAQ